MRETFRISWPYLRRYWRGLLRGLAALLLKDAGGAILPLVMRKGIDALTKGFSIELVFWFAGGMLAVSALKGLFQYWMRVIIIGISRDVEFDLRNDLFKNLISLDAAFYSRFRTGDIMARATNDLGAVRMMLGPGVMYFTETSITALLAVAVMASVDWRLTLLVLIPAPLVSAAVIFFGQRIHDRFEEIQGKFSDISSRVQENLAGVRVIRAYAQEAAELRQFERLNQDYIAQNIRLVKISGLFMPLLQALIAFTFLILLWAGGYRVMQGRMTLGTFVMFNTYLTMLVWPMIAMGWVVNLVQRGKASLGRISELMTERPSIASPPHPVALPDPVCGEIELRDVTVSYAAAKALDGVNLHIPAGSTIAIVGHTGSGKSTLIRLIPRLMDPAAGRVMVDGVDVRELAPEDLRRQIGVVPQETFLFSATIAGNIAFGVEDASMEQVKRAAEIAGLAGDIEGFPKGYDTVVGERGITLSGGQKQRTAIARAILRDPRILILDDALASVDTITEERILRGLTELMRGRTTILISHRVSTVQHADCIYVLEKGRIVEQGSHAELLGNGGYYAGLYQKQLLEEELEAI
jgi:ATP-binding cassette, subfamily B, multidrug efflux pump